MSLKTIVGASLAIPDWIGFNKFGESLPVGGSDHLGKVNLDNNNPKSIKCVCFAWTEYVIFTGYINSNDRLDSAVLVKR